MKNHGIFNKMWILKYSNETRINPKNKNKNSNEKISNAPYT
jgi:hypothetical protein